MIPYLLILAGVFIGVFVFNDLVEIRNKQSVTITLKANSIHDRNEWGHASDDASDDSLEGNILYRKAVQAYKQGDWKVAERYFLDVQTTFNPRIQNYLGLIALKKGEYERAKTLFEEIISLFPDYSAALINLGILSSRLKQSNTAQAYYQRAIEVDVFNPRPYFNLGLLAVRNDFWAVADSLFGLSTGYSSGDFKAHSLYHQSEAKSRMGRRGEALVLVNEAINLKPDFLQARLLKCDLIPDQETRETELIKVKHLHPENALVQFYLGRFYEEIGNYDQADVHFKKVIATGVGNEEVRDYILNYYLEKDKLSDAEDLLLTDSDTASAQYEFFIAKLFYHKGEYDQALYHYQSAFEKSNGEFLKPLINMGITYRKKNATDSAILMYQKALSIQPDYQEANYNLAFTYNKLGQTKKAVEYYLRVTDLNRGNYKAWYNLGNIYKDHKAYKEAVKAYEEALSAQPNYVKAQLNLGIAYNKLLLFDQSKESFLSIIERHPRYKKAWYNLAFTYELSGQFGSAISSYEEVLKLDPEHLKAKNNLGELYHRQKDFQKAISTWKEALDADQGNPNLRYKIALAYYEQGKTKQAIQYLDKTLSLDDSFQKAQELLDKILSKQG